MPVALRPLFRPLLAAAAAVALAACSGGDEAASSPATYAGTLTDSAIQGVSFTASPSGLSGTTDVNGQFLYRAGDTVTFTLGSLELGTVTPTGVQATITPLQLVDGLDITDATEKTNAVTNMLVLLQSIDLDGNPANGITIRTQVRDALTPSIAIALETSLKTAPDSFDDSAELATLFTAAGPDADMVTPTEALAHFREQFLVNMAGTYTTPGAEGAVIYRFEPNGSYLMSQVGPDEAGGTTGLERGQIDWDPTTGEAFLVTTPLQDTNLDWGLSTLRTATGTAAEKLYLSLEGPTLVMKSSLDPENPQYFTRITAHSNSLFGPWIYNGFSLADPHYIFFSSGRVVVIDPVGANCDTPGVELASFTLYTTSSPDDFFLVFSNKLYDTNACDGVHNGAALPASRYYTTPLHLNDDGSLELGTDGTLFRHNYSASL